MTGTCFPHNVKLTHAPVVSDAWSAARCPCSSTSACLVRSPVSKLQVRAGGA